MTTEKDHPGQEHEHVEHSEPLRPEDNRPERNHPVGSHPVREQHDQQPPHEKERVAQAQAAQVAAQGQAEQVQTAQVQAGQEEAAQELTPLERRVRTFAQFIGIGALPPSIAVGLLFYFGYVASRRRFARFGVDLDILDLSTQAVLLYGSEALWFPLVALFLVTMLGLWAHVELARLVRRSRASDLANGSTSAPTSTSTSVSTSASTSPSTDDAIDGHLGGSTSGSVSGGTGGVASADRGGSARAFPRAFPRAFVRGFARAFTRSFRRGGALTWTGIAVFLLGLALLVRGVVGMVNPDIAYNEFPGTTPVCLGLGALVSAYGRWLATWRRTDRRRLLERAAVVGAVSIAVASLFWASASYAVAYGRERATDFAVDLATRPEVVLDTTEPLALGAEFAGVTESKLAPGKGGRYTYRYRNLRLLTESGGRLFLIPAQWPRGPRWPEVWRGGGTLVIPYNDSIRMRLLPYAGP
ncbi:hypothetical protein [Planotetraspora sp. GP83]|uniref:hypothetical protein n=1 Tax=Planotetraspora sp. GP83 TaxID=3156264 RepID=UPI003518BA16